MKGTGISVTESLTAKRNSMLEKAREEYTFNKVWSQDGKMFFNKNTKLKLILVYFFFVDEPDRIMKKKKCVVSIVLLLISFY